MKKKWKFPAPKRYHAAIAGIMSGLMLALVIACCAIYGISVGLLLAGVFFVCTTFFFAESFAHWKDAYGDEEEDEAC